MIFTSEDIRLRLREQPFAPFRLVTSIGQTYDITHPDLLMPGRRYVMAGLPTTDDPTLADQFTRVALVHITELRDLPTRVV